MFFLFFNESHCSCVVTLNAVEGGHRSEALQYLTLHDLALLVVYFDKRSGFVTFRTASVHSLEDTRKGLVHSVVCHM